jgi:hypothetical protein
VKRLLSVVSVMGLIVAVAPTVAQASPQSAGITAVPLVANRDASPVVLTGKQLPQFSAPAPQPVRVLETDSTNLTEVTPPDSSHGANVPVGSLQVFTYSPKGKGKFHQIPAQVDERFWRYLSNPGGENGGYSGYDAELSYVFDQEGYRKTAGDCYAQFPAGSPITTPDPVPGFDDNDELAFMARDAGAQAPAGATPVKGTTPAEVAIKDPLTDQVTYAYVVSAPASRHTFDKSYVSYTRDPYSDRYLPVRGGEGIPEGPICSGPDGDPLNPPTITSNGPRRPADTATFTSGTYSFHWGGRWKPDQIHIRANASDPFGPDLIDQWKGRAFQQTKDQAVSIGFIGEKAWEESSVTLGEKVGPIRVLRETWGAKSGTNVTRLYTLYDKVFYDTFNLRVHPIPPDGIYSMWDNNEGAVSTYYSPMVPGGVPIDGQNDELLGNLDVGQGTPAESHYDIADPTVQPFSPDKMWDEVAGPNGSIVYYTNETKPGPGVITSYYRDDANFDDGSGDNPAGKQGSFGAHGIHFYATGDTDNRPFAFPFTEMSVTQSQYMIPGDPGNVGDSYATTERFPLQITTSSGS